MKNKSTPAGEGREGMAETKPEESTITTNTRITLAAIAMLIAPLVPAVVVYFKVDSMQTEMRQMWSFNQQLLWSERLGSQNPTLKVPPVDEITRLVKTGRHQNNREQ